MEIILISLLKTDLGLKHKSHLGLKAKVFCFDIPYFPADALLLNQTSKGEDDDPSAVFGHSVFHGSKILGCAEKRTYFQILFCSV